MKLVKKGSTYYLRLHRSGKEEWISTQKGSEREAKKVAERIVATFNREKHSRALANKLCEYAKALARQEIERTELSSALALLEKEALLQAMDVIDTLYPAPPILAHDLWERYLQVSGSKVKPVTIKTKYQRYQRFEEWAKERDMREMTEVACRKFLASLKGCSGQTIKNYLSDLSSVFACSSVGNPWTGNLRKELVVDHKETKLFTIDQIKQILQYCDQNQEKKARNIPLSKWADFIRVSYYTGLRPSDVCCLQKSEYSDGVMDLLPEKTSRTRNRISFRVHPEVDRILSLCEIGGDKEYFFPDFAALYNRDRGYISPPFRQIRNAAGITDDELTLYSLRHHFVTYQIDSGEDDETVASVVGHTSTQTTKGTYYHGKTKVELTDLPIV